MMLTGLLSHGQPPGIQQPQQQGSSEPGLPTQQQPLGDTAVPMVSYGSDFSQQPLAGECARGSTHCPVPQVSHTIPQYCSTHKVPSSWAGWWKVLVILLISRSWMLLWSM